MSRWRGQRKRRWTEEEERRERKGGEEKRGEGEEVEEGTMIINILCKELTVYLRCIPSSLYSDSDVDELKSLSSQYEDWLEELVAKKLGLQIFNRLTVDFHQTATSLTICNCNAGLLTTEHLHAIDHDDDEMRRRDEGGG